MSAIIRSFLQRPLLMRSTILRPGASNPCRSFSSQTWTSIGLRNTVQRPFLCHMKHFKVSREVHSSSSLSATMNQAMRRPKKSPKKVRRSKPKSPYLENGPQKKGVCVALMIGKPKKPNSAKRKIARVKLTTGKTILCYVPGEGHNLQEHSVVLVRGGRAQDLPGVRYRLVRGALDFNGVVNRRTARSKYGAKKPKA